MKHLQSRREFFKEASEKALPILGMALLSSTPILNSCTKDPDPSECNGCSNNCEGNSTSTSCSSCSNNCQNNSTSTGCSSCSNNCQNSSTNSGCSNCSSGCDSECTNDCSSNCSNSANNSSNDTISEASGAIDGHDYVDLGLSVKWARCNVDATTPYTRGFYGDASIYTLVYPEDILDVLVAYGLFSGTDWRQHEVAGIPEFDMATKKWGNNWTTPSESEWQELRDNCDFEAFEYENVSGVKVTSRINRNSIFLPLPGSYSYNFEDVGTRVDFPSSTIKTKLSTVSMVGSIRIKKDLSTNEIRISSNWTTNKPFHRAVTTGFGGGSTNCNGNCTNTAQNNCSSCQVGCSTGCTQQCSSNCSTGCKTDCTSNCPNMCSTGCGGACYYSCGGNCSYVSSGSHCTAGTCATTCISYCYHTCSLACSESCMSCCITSSK